MTDTTTTTDQERARPDYAGRIRQLFTQLFADETIPPETHTAADADLAALAAERAAALTAAESAQQQVANADALITELRSTADRLGRRAATAEGNLNRAVAYARVLETLIDLDMVDRLRTEHGVADLLNEEAQA